MNTLKIQLPKTTKIGPGEYKFQYKGFDVSVSKVEGYPNWFSAVSGQCNDWQTSKKEAILAAVEGIDMGLYKVKYS